MAPRDQPDQWYFEDVDVGDVFHIPPKTITETHLVLFAGLTGDFNPIHVDKHYTETETTFDSRIAHSTMIGMFAVVGASELEPHIRTTAVDYRRQEMRFPGTIHIGDTIYPSLTVADKVDEGAVGVVVLETRVTDHDDNTIMEGEIELVLATRGDSTSQ